MLSFELKGIEAIKSFLSHLTLFTLAESLGGVETLICHPATMTHAGMSEEARKPLGSVTLYCAFPWGLRIVWISSTIYKMRLMQQRKGNHGS